MRILQAKAVCALKWLEATTAPGSDQLSAGAGPGLVKRLREDLEIPSESDLLVLLALAERYRPGVFVQVLELASAACMEEAASPTHTSQAFGDPASIEKRFEELFDSF